MTDRCSKYGGVCIGCGECDFERKYAAVFSAEDINKRIEELRSLRKKLSKGLERGAKP